MAVSEKNARNIIVDGVHYRWRATGNDGWISLIVWPPALPGQKVTCSFDYHQTLVPGPVVDGVQATHATQQLVVTNRLVRRVLLHALSVGYRPDVKKKGQLDLGAAEAFISVEGAVRAK